MLCFVLVRVRVRVFVCAGVVWGLVWVGGFLVLSCLSVLILRSISEAIMLLSATASRLALCRSTRAPQNGQVRDFWSTAASSSPLHWLHSMTYVMGIRVRLFRKTFPHTVR